LEEALESQLRQFDLFKPLPDEALSDLDAKFKRVELKKGEVLFNKGDQGDALYILQEGQAKITSTDGEGNEVVLNQVGPGAVIGEMTIIDREPRSAGVVALTDSSFLELNSADFSAALEAQPQMGMEISRGLIQRLRFATTYIENAIEWSQLIAKGDYSFIENLDKNVAETESDSEQERAARFLGAFFQMVEEIKAREDELKQELTRLKVEIDEARRKKDVEEIAQSEFFQELQKRKQKKAGDD
jgi:CRP-like cAMP-binding protein